MCIHDINVGGREREKEDKQIKGGKYTKKPQTGCDYLYELIKKCVCVKLQGNFDILKSNKY